MATLKEIYEDSLENYKYRSDEEQLDAPCPFHKTKSGAPFTANIRTGLFKCHNPSCEANGGGNINKFLKMMGTEDADKILRSLKAGIEKDLVPKEITKKHKALLETPSILKFLSTHAGITLDTVKKFKLGWDGVRIWIPIYVEGKLTNIRKYNPINEVKTLGVKKHNQPEIFPYKNLSKKVLYFCEGEKDTILANQMGLNAITVTGAGGVLPKLYLSKFVGKTIYIIHDVDAAGEKAVNRLFLMLRKVADKIVKVTLPVEPPNKDLTEYIINEGKTIEDVHAAVEEGKVLLDRSNKTTEIPIDTTLNKIHSPEFFEHLVKIDTLVIGKDVDPYVVPKRIKVQCNNPGSVKNCKVCPIIGDSIELEFSDLDLIKFINIPDKQLQKTIVDLAFIPTCSNVEIQKLEMLSLFRVQLQTPISSSNHSTADKPATAQGFILDHNVEANKVYSCIGLVTADPKTQYSTLVIKSIKPTNSEIDNFYLTETWITRLSKLFQISS